MKTYVVIGNYYANIEYGADGHSFIFGIYQNEDEATKAAEEFKKSDSIFIFENEILVEDKFGYVRFVEEDDLFDDERPVKYSDFNIFVSIFDGSPMECMQIGYCE